MFRPAISACAVTLLGATLLAQQPPAGSPAKPGPQNPPITFRSEVNYVEVDAVVVDTQGNFVRNLTKNDFQVFEDGKPQTVSAFSLVDIPVERAESPAFLGRTVEPDVVTNAKPPDGRLYVLVLDDIHTDLRRTGHVRRLAKEFVDKYLGANDLAAVIHASGRADASQDFTSNKRLLDDAIDKFMGKKLRSATLNKIDDYYLQLNSGISNNGAPGSSAVPADPEELQRAYNARALLSTLASLSDYISSIHGRRKAIVLFGEGIDYDISRPMELSESSAVRQETNDAIGAATRGNVSIYSIDPRGLTDAGDDGIMLTALPGGDPNALNLGISGLMDEIRLSQDSLRELADDTGGFAVLNTNNPATQLERIVKENSSYYVLGYYPGNERRDGKFRKLEVRMTRPGLLVHTRNGYVAPSGRAPAPKKVDAGSTTPPALREALNSPLQTPGLELSMFTAPFKGPAPNASLAIVTQFMGKDINFTQKDGKFNNAIEMSYILVDPQGKVVTGNKDIVNMALKPETYKRVMQVGFRLQAKIDVPPGRYTLRLAVHETGGRVGSVFSDLVIPDFTKEPLSMSGLAITSAAAAQVPTAGASDLKDLLPAAPTTLREFSVRDQLAILAEVYDNLGPLAHGVEISTTLRGDDGRPAFSYSERRQSTELKGSRGGYGFTTRIPLTGLAPGLYVLRVEAKASVGKPTSTAREVQFRIVP